MYKFTRKIYIYECMRIHMYMYIWIYIQIIQASLLQKTEIFWLVDMQRTATYCKTLQQDAKHCNTQNIHTNSPLVFVTLINNLSMRPHHPTTHTHTQTHTHTHTHTHTSVMILHTLAVLRRYISDLRRYRVLLRKYRALWRRWKVTELTGRSPSLLPPA